MAADSHHEQVNADARAVRQRELAQALPATLLLITDRHRTARSITEAVQEAVQAGVRWVRVREPDLDPFGYMSLCHALIDTVADDRVAWSVRPSAYLLMRSSYPEMRLGVHLASADASWRAPEESVLVGRSVHAGDTVLTEDSVAYRLFAPVFETESKPGAVPAGLAALAAAAQIAASPVVALGGISPRNVQECIDAGAAGVAVCGGVLGAASVERAVRAYLQSLGEIGNP